MSFKVELQVQNEASKERRKQETRKEVRIRGGTKGEKKASNCRRKGRCAVLMACGDNSLCER